MRRTHSQRKIKSVPIAARWQTQPARYGHSGQEAKPASARPCASNAIYRILTALHSPIASLARIMREEGAGNPPASLWEFKMRFTITCEVEAASAAAAVQLFAGTAAAAAATAPVATAAAPVETLADKIRDFLTNDTSGYDWRSSDAISKAIGATMEEVEAAASASSDLASKRSTRGMGVLISLA
jgi:hypothetical protein